MTGWHYIIRRCHHDRSQWLALAKRERFITDGDPIAEPGDLWFEFGASEAEARAKIEAETRSMSN